MFDQMRFKRAVGLADSCELMAVVWSFPDDRLAQALGDGSFAADVQSCLADAGAGVEERECAARSFEGFSDNDPRDISEELKRGYSRLFLVPGADVSVFPYEGAFCHVRSGRRGTPSLFRTPNALDVEKRMNEAGVATKKARKEPSDSVWSEFGFLSYGYGSMAAALHHENDADAEIWRNRIDGFHSEHIAQWLPAFMDQTDAAIEMLETGYCYASFTELGRAVLRLIDEDLSTM